MNCFSYIYAHSYNGIQRHHKYDGKWKWQPTPVFLLGKPHGQRRVAGYSPWGRKELETTEWLTYITAQFKRRMMDE